MLTATGRRDLHQIDAALDRAQEAVLAPLDPKERAQLVLLLRRLLGDG